MIEVPERVKDALREGIYKKEYRFVVSYTRDIIAYTFESTSDIITIEESGDYQWVAGGAPGVIGEYEVSSGGRPSGGGDIVNGATISLQSGDMISTYAMDITPINLKSGEEEVSFTIDNDTLVKESVHIDERVCSGDRLKFGLCEGTSLEFQYFDHPNIKGNQIQAFIDVQYKDGDGTLKWYAIPMGFFDVDECSMQFSTGVRKSTTYNKLKSDYLDAKANNLLLNVISNPEMPMLVYDIQNLLLNDYQITPQQELSENMADHLYIASKLGLATKLTSATLAVTPINYYNVLEIAEKPWNTTFYIGPLACAWRWTCNPSEYYTFKSTFDLGEWEHQLVEYLRTLIDSSQLNKTSDQFFNWVASSAEKKWLSIFGILIEYADGTEQTFSDEAYSRGVATGRFSDIINRTFTNVSEVSLWLIRTLDMQEREDSSGNIYSYVGLPINGPNYEYRYGVYPTFKFPDGTDLPEYAKDGHVEPIPDWFQVYRNLNMNDAERISVVPSEMSDFTLRDIVSANYEIACQYGKLDRETDLFSGIELNGSRLLPADDLYPDDALLPYGGAEGSFKSQYKKLWFDEGGIQKFRYLIVTYKGTEEDPDSHQIQEVEKTLQRTVNTDGTVDYNMSDNWLFRNLIWTDEQVGEYADAMVLKMKNITWFPFEMWAAGLPYLEAGDEIEINAHDQTYTSYILNRQLRGIQNLEDTFVNGQLDIF